jgi:predicted nucleic acid-binding protein
MFLHLAAAADAPLISGDSDLIVLRDRLPVDVLTVQEWRGRLASSSS